MGTEAAVTFRKDTLVRWNHAEPKIGSVVCRYGKLYRRYAKGWRLVGSIVMPKEGVVRNPSGRYISWEKLFYVNGDSDFVVLEDD